MATNDFLAFCPTDTGTNLLTQVEYAADPNRTAGNQPGVASSKLNNKAVRQAAAIISQIAQYISDKTGSNVLDDGDLTALQNIMIAAWAPPTQSYEIDNLTIATSVAASALTIAVKTKAGSNASATDVISVGFRSSTLTSGIYNIRTITGALSLVVPSGATLGQTSAAASVIWLYLIDNAGTPELACSHSFYPEVNTVSTTAISSGSSSATVMYSTTSRSNVSARFIGYIVNTQATAGTWASAGTNLQLVPTQSSSLPVIQRFTSGSGTVNIAAGCTWFRLRMVGGGAGGGGNGTSGASAGTAGNATTFDTFTASGGSGGGLSSGSTIGQRGQGGGLSGSPNIFSCSGGDAIGGAGVTNTAPSAPMPGGNGGSSYFGGAGGGGTNTAGSNAKAQTGSGGSGAGGNTSVYSAAGGGSGAYIEHIYTNPASSYSYGVGGSAAGGSAGTSGFAGGDGAAGIIVIEQYFF